MAGKDTDVPFYHIGKARLYIGIKAENYGRD